MVTVLGVCFTVTLCLCVWLITDVWSLRDQVSQLKLELKIERKTCIGLLHNIRRQNLDMVAARDHHLKVFADYQRARSSEVVLDRVEETIRKFREEGEGC